MKSWFADYLPILLGLLAGVLAHFGEHVERHGWPSARAVAGFLMQQGVVGLIAVVVVRQFGIISPDYKAFLAAVFAVSSNEVIRWARQKSTKIADTALPFGGGDDANPAG